MIESDYVHGEMMFFSKDKSLSRIGCLSNAPVGYPAFVCVVYPNMAFDQIANNDRGCPEYLHIDQDDETKQISKVLLNQQQTL